METKSESVLHSRGDQILTEVKIEYSGIKLEPVFDTTDTVLSEYTNQSHYESKPEASELFRASNNNYNNQMDNDLSYTVVKCEKDAENCDVDVVNTDDEVNHGGIASVEQNSNASDNDNIDEAVLELCQEISLENGEDTSVANNFEHDEDLTNAISILHDAMMAETAPNMKAYTDHSDGDINRESSSGSKVDVSDSFTNSVQNTSLSMYDILKSRARRQNVWNAGNTVSENLNNGKDRFVSLKSKQNKGRKKNTTTDTKNNHSKSAVSKKSKSKCKISKVKTVCSYSQETAPDNKIESFKVFSNFETDADKRTRHMREEEGLQSSSDHRENYEKSICSLKSDYMCPVCIKVFDNGKMLLNHQKNEHNSKIFHCDDCNRWFSTRLLFDKHNRMHSNARPYKCSKCRKSYTAYKYLRHHLKVHGEKKFSCTVCGKAFTSKKYVESHERSHTTVRPYKCTDCNKSYKYDAQLRIHRRIHTGQRFYCDICQKGFVDKGDMKRHYSVHSGVKEYECDICGRAFRQKSTLRVHMLVHQDPVEAETFKCNVCDKIVLRRSYLKKHMEIHAADRPSFTCDKCGMSFAMKARLQKHLRFTCKNNTENQQQLEWKCATCGKCLKTKEYLKKHEKKHINGWKFPCKQCDRSYSQKYHLKRHIQFTHLKVKPNGTICKICRNPTLDLKAHMKRHIGEKKYSCSTCGKQFKHRANVRVHENIHLDKLPYQCDHCQERFAQIGSLKRHIKNHHLPRSKPVKLRQDPDPAIKGTRCKICSVFIKHRMDAHMKIHEKEGPYLCPVCGRDCKNKSRLNTHKLIHLDIKPWKCDVCQITFAQKNVMKMHILCRHIPTPTKNE